MLIVDANDQTIDGGEGFDLVQVVGDFGVNLNFFESKVEVVFLI